VQTMAMAPTASQPTPVPGGWKPLTATTIT
jgi:hypothetical protein